MEGSSCKERRFNGAEVDHDRSLLSSIDQVVDCTLAVCYCQVDISLVTPESYSSQLMKS